jgi:hypothetical protein
MPAPGVEEPRSPIGAKAWRLEPEAGGDGPDRSSNSTTGKEPPPRERLTKFVADCAVAIDAITDQLPQLGIPRNRAELATEAWKARRPAVLEAVAHIRDKGDPSDGDFVLAGLTGAALNLKLLGFDEQFHELKEQQRVLEAIVVATPMDLAGIQGWFFRPIVKAAKGVLRWAKPTIGSLMSILKLDPAIAAALEALGETMDFIENLLHDADDNQLA